MFKQVSSFHYVGPKIKLGFSRFGNRGPYLTESPCCPLPSLVTFMNIQVAEKVYNPLEVPMVVMAIIHTAVKLRLEDEKLEANL